MFKSQEIYNEYLNKCVFGEGFDTWLDNLKNKVINEKILRVNGGSKSVFSEALLKNLNVKSFKCHYPAMKDDPEKTCLRDSYFKDYPGSVFLFDGIYASSEVLNYVTTIGLTKNPIVVRPMYGKGPEIIDNTFSVIIEEDHRQKSTALDDRCIEVATPKLGKYEIENWFTVLHYTE